MRIKDTNETTLILDNPYAGVGLQARIQNGELRSITLLVDRHKGSSLAAEWDRVKICGGLVDLKFLHTFCGEMIEEIEKRLAVAQPVGQDEEESE